MRKLTKTTIGSRFGYGGSARRIWSITTTSRVSTWRSALGYVAAVTLVAFAWILVTVWYFVLLAVLGIFAPILAAVWIIRWGDRRRTFREEQDDAALLRMMAGDSDGPTKD
jgi:Flp pilus assembly protein TadB